MVVASAISRMQGLCCGVASCTVSSSSSSLPSSSSSSAVFWLKPLLVTRPGIAVSSIGFNNNSNFFTERFWRFDGGRGMMMAMAMAASPPLAAAAPAGSSSKLAATTTTTTTPLLLLQQIGTTLGSQGRRRRYTTTAIATTAAASRAEEARPRVRIVRLAEQQQALMPSCSLRRHKSRSYRCFARNKAIAEDDDELVQVVNDGGRPPTPEPGGTSWPILERWNVPWDGKVTAVGMAIWLFSFLTTGLAVSAIAANLGISKRQVMDLDEQALFIFVHQLAQTIAGLSALNVVLAPHQPYPPQLFSYDWSSPLDLHRGWLLYGGIGVIGAAAAVVAVSTLAVTVTGQPPPREEADALLQLLPIIGASPTSTAALIAVTGVLAPILEESVFRGFLMTSLTKWVPTPVAVVISACAFAGAHLTPGEFPQLVALGVILGLAYAQTRTLITPILIHATWNSGVIVLLTLLRLQGYDIREFL